MNSSLNLSPGTFIDKFKVSKIQEDQLRLVIQNVDDKDPLADFDVEPRDPSDIFRPRFMVIFKGKHKFAENKLAISFLTRSKSYCRPDEGLVTEAILLLENDGLFVPYYPEEYGYNFEKTNVFNNTQEIINHLRIFARNITPVTHIQFGDFEPVLIDEVVI